MKEISEYKEAVVEWIDANKAEFEKISHHLFAHPELGLEEYESAKQLTDVLEKYGFTVDKGVSGMPTAFVASYGSGKPVIGFNAEYDCLPGLSQKAGSPKKEPVIEGAPGQGCGHCILGTAEVLWSDRIKSDHEK